MHGGTIAGPELAPASVVMCIPTSGVIARAACRWYRYRPSGVKANTRAPKYFTRVYASAAGSCLAAMDARTCGLSLHHH